MMLMGQMSDDGAIGVDVGGTSTRFALVDSAGRVYAHQKRPTLATRSTDEFLRWLVQGLTSLIPETTSPTSVQPNRLSNIGLAVPGLVHQPRGCVIRSVNLSFLEGMAIRSALAEATGCVVKLMTDSAAATWGEFRASDVPPSHFAHLRLGTGIACGVVRDGQLVDLDEGRTTHLSALVVEHGTDAVICPCGLRGCLETIASGRALAEQWSAAGGEGTLPALRSAYVNNHNAARKIVNRASAGLRVAISQVARELGVAQICLGGGVSDHFPELANLVIAKATPGSSPTVRCALLGDQAGVIGAALLAMQD